MKLVPDAHIALWPLTGPPRVSPEVSRLICRRPKNLFSVTQIWDMDFEIVPPRIAEVRVRM
jgi:PIN domain nuclease of toxin-antitoxin system